MGMKARAAAILDRAKLFEAVLWVRSRLPASGQLPVLTYHHLRDLEADYPFDPGVVDASPGLFEEQMAFVARWFTTVGIDELRAAALGAALPGNAIAITFDDGYKSNLELAVPILRRHGLRAIFFFATAYIDERRLFWWDRIAYLVGQTRRESFALTYPEVVVLDLRSPSGRQQALRALLSFIKHTQRLDLERFLTELTDAADVPWDRALETRLAGELILTWDEVRAIRNAGFDVQSHTRNHRVLSTISLDEVRHELETSRADLERELGEKVTAVSYPCGFACSAEETSSVRDAGYELGFAAKGGVNAVGNGFRPLNLARIAIDYDTPMSLFRGTLAVPNLAR